MSRYNGALATHAEGTRHHHMEFRLRERKEEPGAPPSRSFYTPGLWYAQCMNHNHNSPPLPTGAIREEALRKLCETRGLAPHEESS